MNTTQAINTILSNTQRHMNKVCRVVMRDGENHFVYSWEALAGVRISLYLMDKFGENCHRISVDHNNLTDYITHVGDEEIL